MRAPLSETRDSTLIRSLAVTATIWLTLAVALSAASYMHVASAGRRAYLIAVPLGVALIFGLSRIIALVRVQRDDAEGTRLGERVSLLASSLAETRRRTRCIESSADQLVDGLAAIGALIGENRMSEARDAICCLSALARGTLGSSPRTDSLAAAFNLARDHEGDAADG